MEIENSKKEADVYKNKGNEYFAKKEFALAAE